MLTRTSTTQSRRAARHAGRGVTLIELLTAVAVLAVALSLAAPSMSEQFANYRLRSAAEGIINGLNYARAEAVRRNTAVTFTLDASGPGWSVDQVTPAQTLQQRASGESPGITATPGSTSLVVTFLSTGFVDTTGDRLSRISLSSAVANTESRRIDIFGGGLIRMCDPSATATDDPRRC